MNAEQLKNSILQRAVEGKLVEQREEEGTAAELLREIKEEKARLVKEGKLKKNNLPSIVLDCPFPLPPNWIIVRLSDICYIKSGLSFKKNMLEVKTDNMIRVLRGGNINDLSFKTRPDDVFIDKQFVKDELFLQKNTLITPAVTSIEQIGKMARIPRDYINTVVGGFVLMLIPYISVDILSQYLLFIFGSTYYRDIFRQSAHKSGQAFYNLSRNKLLEIALPLPPLAEQKRIVAKIEELLPHVEQYGKAHDELTALNEKFPDAMKKSVLQYAMEGKLVEQREEEGTAKELLSAIKAEKARLVKEGKLKKEKPLPEIKAEELPFEIPESWEWVRLGEILIFENGDRSGKYPKQSDQVSDGIPFWGAADMINGLLSYTNELRFITEQKFNELRAGKLIDKDFVCLLRGAVGKWAQFHVNEKYSTGFINAQMVIMRAIFIDICPFYAKYLASAAFGSQVLQTVTGTAVAQMSAADLKMFMLPLPPLAEQKRIVAKIEELFINLATLKQNVN